MISKDSIWSDMRTVKGRKAFAKAVAGEIVKGAGEQLLGIDTLEGTWPHCLEIRAIVHDVKLFVTIGRDNVPFAWFATLGKPLEGLGRIHGVSQGMNPHKGTCAPVWDILAEPFRFLEALRALASAFADRAGK